MLGFIRSPNFTVKHAQAIRIILANGSGWQPDCCDGPQRVANLTPIQTFRTARAKKLKFLADARTVEFVSYRGNMRRDAGPLPLVVGQADIAVASHHEHTGR
jgi:hypothetical protein